MKWWTRVMGLFIALAGGVYLLLGSSHRKKQQKRLQKADDLADRLDISAGAAKAEREKAKAAHHRANAALAEGRARIEKLKEQGNADLADRLRRFNERMRNNDGA